MSVQRQARHGHQPSALCGVGVGPTEARLEARLLECDVMPNGPGVRTARKLLVGIGIGLAFISICSVAALIYLSQLNTIVRHLALDPVPGSAAIASMAKDFNQYRLLEVSSPTSGGTRDTTLAGKAAEIEREGTDNNGNVTTLYDRRQ